MAILKTTKFGLYGSKDRLLQKKLSYERLSLTAKTVKIYKYLGSRVNVTPNVDDIQDPIFLEVPDRAYATTPIEINVWYETLPESPVDLSRFGIINPLGDMQQFRFHSYSFEADGLGRYIVANDIIEVPFLLQDGKKTYFEVEDVDRKGEFENFFVIVNAKPISDKQEVTEIPNINTNSTFEATHATDFESYVNAHVALEGIDTSTVDIDNDISPRPNYDPRPDSGESFLDDPNNIIVGE